MLKALAEKCEVASRTHFLGKVAYEELPEYLAACDIFIRPSRSEGMGNAFIEAMAARLPVIGTQVGGIADFLFDRVRNPEMETTGWAVDPDSPPQIARAVEDILSQPEEVGRVVRHAYTLVASRYDWARIAREMQTKVFSQITS
jgi:glycogen(starch) synthase